MAIDINKLFFCLYLCATIKPCYVKQTLPKMVSSNADGLLDDRRWYSADQYSANKRASDEWLIWGIVAAAIITSGLGLLGNAYVHKVKSDLIRKQRSREPHSAVEEG